MNDWEWCLYSFFIIDFGVVGDGMIFNIYVFERVMLFFSNYVDKGGVELYIFVGRWFIGSIRLISYFMLFLESGVIIFGLEVML